MISIDDFDLNLWLELLAKGVWIEVRTPHKWVRVTDKEHLIKCVEADCKMRAKPTNNKNWTKEEAM